MRRTSSTVGILLAVGVWLVALCSPAAATSSLKVRLAKPSAVFLTSPCITCSFEWPAVRISVKITSCTPGENYTAGIILFQDGQEVSEIEGALGAAEGIPCPPNGKLVLGVTFASPTLHAGLATVATADIYNVTLGNALVATTSGVVRIPKN